MTKSYLKLTPLRPNAQMANQDQKTGNQFLKELDKKLWTAAEKLRVNLDAAVYKHAVLGVDLSKIRLRFV